ncbi:uncharacterized protein LOC133907160 [Phragmites australis]|uniref:uncharacterized protein LOC133907160 n=1 Tax=Phragmites australis TaxID=29695 RepID=UPI002D78AB6E|nr:uncharacterized protein LOC133907160 [Phragmites australis]
MPYSLTWYQPPTILFRCPNSRADPRRAALPRAPARRAAPPRALVLHPAAPTPPATMPGTPPASPKAGDDSASTATAAQVEELGLQQHFAKEKASATAAAAQRQAARDAALARALQAEEEAAAAAKDRDAAALRASEALARAAQERAAAASSDADCSSAPPAPTDLHSAMLLHEALALLNLHAQAVAVNNIRTHVPIVLDVDSGNFNRWRDQFMLTLGKFSLQDHVCCDPPVTVSLDWARMDCVVKSWIVGTLTDDLAEVISAQGSTARHAWLAVESQFLGNREARAIHLETKFRNFVQGDLSITDYCRRLKKMADDLTALSEVITDRTLVLNVIRGLNERFDHVGALLRRARPFPTFLEARDDLILEELTLENRKDAPATALAASTTSGPPNATPPSSGMGSSGAGGARSSNNRRSKRGGGGKGGNNGGGTAGQGQRPSAGA